MLGDVSCVVMCYPAVSRRMGKVASGHGIIFGFV